MVDLISNLLLIQMLPWDNSFWGNIIHILVDFIGSFGWAIILLTLVLKLIFMPLDYLQRKSGAKTRAMNEKMAPEIENIKRKYAKDPATAQQKIQEKQMEMYKSNGMLGSCVVMFLNFVAIAVVFLTLLTGLSGIGNIKTTNLYTELRNTYDTIYQIDDVNNYEKEEYKTKYNEVYDETIIDSDEATAKESARIAVAQMAVVERYNNGDLIESFLWVKNIWRPDTRASIIPTYKEFITLSKYQSKTEGQEDYLSEDEYNIVMSPIINMEKGWNGYYILIILAGVISFFSGAVASGGFKKKDKKKDKKKADDNGKNAENAQEQATQMAAKAGGVLKYVLPIIMVLITLWSNAIFTVYVIINALFSLCMTPIYNKFIKKSEDKNRSGNGNGKNKDAIVVDYRIQKHTIIKE